MPTITIEEAQAKLPDLINKLATGVRIVITRNSQPVAELMPIQSANPQPVFGSCKGLLTIVTEDEEHLEDFKEYMS
jgi:prevent-host-death family protein